MSELDYMQPQRGALPRPERLAQNPPQRTLRFYNEHILERLREAVAEDPNGVSVNTWIMRAIAEKLKREEDEKRAN